MNLRKLILTENACYKTGEKITVKGLMLHSTGANNPWLNRYVGPDDGLLGSNKYGNHWNTYHPEGREICVHGFIGKLADGSIATYQTLPWNHKGWHAGGSANSTHIGVEICEDGLTDSVYFNQVYKEAVELFAYLCKMFNLTEKSIICHCEGNKLGIASNHADVMHWFPKHGKSMDTFRADVKALLNEGTTPTTPDEGDNLYRVQVGAFSSEQNAKSFKTELENAGFSTYLVKDGGFYKIQVGAFSEKANAQNMLNQLNEKGFVGFITTASGSPVSPSPSITIGSRVKVVKGAKTYEGSSLASFVYDTFYYVRELNGDRAVIAPAMTGAVTAAINTKDLILQ